MLVLCPKRCSAPLLFLLGCGQEEPPPPPWELPETAAESRYIEYGTWADDSSICMGDVLAELDRHIETVAGFLEVEPPPQKIRYTWVPAILKAAETWPCNDPSFMNLGCHRRYEDISYVFADAFDNRHELVHAVDVGANGQGHPVLEEGLAMYLGDSYSTAGFIDDFPAKFQALLEQGGRPDYVLSLHFVGSIIERDGVEKFKNFRRHTPVDADGASFAAAYLGVYGQDLESALGEMTSPIRTLVSSPPPCEGEHVEWVGGPDLRVQLRGHCGDGYFFGGGLVGDEPGFFKSFTIDVPTKGLYEMSLTGAGDAAVQTAAYMFNCPDVEPGSVGAIRGYSSKGLLYPGRHQVGVNFPQAAEPAGELTLLLRYEPPPSPDTPPPARAAQDRASLPDTKGRPGERVRRATHFRSGW